MDATIDYLGFRFLDSGLAGIRGALTRALTSQSYGYVVTPNVDHIVTYYRGGDEDLMRAYDGASMQICDSRVLALLGKAAGHRLTACPGSDITRSLLENPLQGGVTIAVVGPDEAAFALLSAKYPEAELRHIPSAARLTVGSIEWNATVERARDMQWDLLLVCLSFPKQEFFARDLKRFGRRTGVALCVGASVDFLTGRQKRAPEIFQRAGLEWFYRLASNPKRMANRYLVRGPAIFSIVASDLVRPKAAAPARPVLASPEPGHASPPRILFLTTVLPHEQQGGGEICSMNMIDALTASGAMVDVVGYRRAGSTAPLPEGFTSPRDLTIESAGAKSEAARWMARALMRGRPFSIEKYVTPQMRRLVTRKLAGNTYDCVVIDHAQAGWLLPLLPRDLPVVLNAHNVEHDLYARYSEHDASGPNGAGLRDRLKARLYRREAARMERVERELSARACQIWTLTDADAEAFAALAPNRAVRTFGVPGKPLVDSESDPVRDIDVGLLGNWAWDINRAGLDWFVEEVAPKLAGGLSIEVGGRSLHQPGTSRNGVRFVGFVPDAATFLKRCKVVAIPSVTGSGIQIKTIETLSLGVPTVATPIAMRGIGAPPPSVRIARSADDMAAAIAEALAEDRGAGPEGPRWWAERRTHFEGEVASALSAALPVAASPATAELRDDVFREPRLAPLEANSSSITGSLSRGRSGVIRNGSRAKNSVPAA